MPRVEADYRRTLDAQTTRVQRIIELVRKRHPEDLASHDDRSTQSQERAAGGRTHWDDEVDRSIRAEQVASRASPATVALLRRVAGFLALGASIVGLLVCLGYAFAWPTLTTALSASPTPVRWWAAVCFILVGAGTAAVAFSEKALARRVGFTLGVVAVVLAVITLLEHSTGLNLMSDNPFAPLPESPAHPDRMLLAVAVAFTFLGLSLALHSTGRVWACQALASVPIAIGFLAVVSHVFGVSDSYRAVLASVIPPTAAIGILMSGLVLLALRADGGLAETIFGSTAGGRIARRLTPVVVLVPGVLGWLVLELVRRGYVDAPFALALLVTGVSAAGAVAVAIEAMALRTLDVQRAGTTVALGQVRAAEAKYAQLAAELAESERRTRNILDTALDAIMDVDATGVITSWNPAAEQLYGWSAQEAIGARLDELVPIYKDGKALKVTIDGPYFEMAIARGPAEFTVVHKDGTPIEVESRVWAHDEATGRCYTELARDIADRCQARRELLDVNHRLDDFAAVAAHDLRGPLTTIVGYVELLEDRALEQGDEAALSIIHRITQATERGGQLIDDLLDYSRAGRGAFEPHRVDLSALARAAAEDVRARVDRPCDLDVADLAPVIGEEGPLRQVFSNLLYNAVRYCPPERVPHVVVAAQISDGTHAVVTVSDNGAGIPEAERERIFEMFQRGSTGKAKSGSGVGLALCRRVVERHGGRIWVESAPGGGSMFCLTLPRHFRQQ